MILDSQRHVPGAWKLERRREAKLPRIARTCRKWSIDSTVRSYRHSSMQTISIQTRMWKDAFLAFRNWWVTKFRMRSISPWCSSMHALNLVVKLSSLAPPYQVLRTCLTIPIIKRRLRLKTKLKWTFLSPCMITLKNEQILDWASTKIYDQRRKSKFLLHMAWTWPSDDLCFIWRFSLLFSL